MKTTPRHVTPFGLMGLPESNSGAVLPYIIARFTIHHQRNLLLLRKQMAAAVSINYVLFLIIDTDTRVFNPNPNALLLHVQIWYIESDAV